jgi:hypothetical protein
MGGGCIKTGAGLFPDEITFELIRPWPKRRVGFRMIQN